MAILQNQEQKKVSFCFCSP